MIDIALSRGMVLYTGYRSGSFPSLDAADVEREFGLAYAEIVCRCRKILWEIDQIEIDWDIHDIQSAAEVIDKAVRQRFPQLGEIAIKAIVWNFAYQNR